MADDEIPTFPKDPNATVDFDIDWNPDQIGRDPYLDAGETILASGWAIDAGPDDALFVSGSPAPTVVGGTRTKCWVSGGTAGGRYRLRNRISTSMGREDDRSIWIAVRHR